MQTGRSAIIFRQNGNIGSSSEDTMGVELAYV